MKKKYEEKINEDKNIRNQLEERIKSLIKEKNILEKNAEKPIQKINELLEIKSQLQSENNEYKENIQNLIYPKVSQAKYLFNGIRDDFDSNQKNRSLIEDYNINQNKIKSKFILYQLKKRKINQTVYSKYPLYLTNNKSKSEKI